MSNWVHILNETQKNGDKKNGRRAKILIASQKHGDKEKTEESDREISKHQKSVD